MNEPALWWFAAAIAVGALLVSIAYAINSFLEMTWLNIEGAGRKVLVGVHAWRREHAGVYPWPHEPKRASYILPLLMRPYMYVDPDRDEARLDISLSLIGAVESTENAERARVILRVSWSIPDWVRFYDIRGPGDHGDIPANLKRRINDEVYLPGAAVIAFMNDYVQGEHLSRLYETVTLFTRAFFGRIDVHELINLGRHHPRLTLTYPSPMIRGQAINWLGADAPIVGSTPQEVIAGTPELVSWVCTNQDEVQQVARAFITHVCQHELKVYGIHINEINVVQLEVPPSIINQNRILVGRLDNQRSMKIFANSLAENLGTLTDKHVDADIAALVLAQETGTGPFAALVKLMDLWKKR